jgi:hypothetical protein
MKAREAELEPGGDEKMEGRKEDDESDDVANVGDWQVAGIKCLFVHVDATTKSCQTTGNHPFRPASSSEAYISNSSQPNHPVYE